MAGKPAPRRCAGPAAARMARARQSTPRCVGHQPCPCEPRMPPIRNSSHGAAQRGGSPDRPRDGGESTWLLRRRVDCSAGGLALRPFPTPALHAPRQACLRVGGAASMASRDLSSLAKPLAQVAAESLFGATRIEPCFPEPAPPPSDTTRTCLRSVPLKGGPASWPGPSPHRQPAPLGQEA